MEAWESIAAETERAFAWLTRDIDAGEPVTFVPNPGNVGDAFINLACYRWLAARFSNLTVCSVQDAPKTDRVFIAGGGNLIDGLYTTVSDFVTARCADRRLFFFPSSVKGFDRWLAGLSGRARMICREPVSHAHVAEHLPPADVLLAHDAAFSLAPIVRTAFAEAIGRHPQAQARFLRDDGERAQTIQGDADVMAHAGGYWTDLAAAERAVAEAATTMLRFGRIYTDRLHGAILAAMLDRYVVLMPNSYYKNRTVFDHSLRRFANVRFQDEDLATRA
jgi:exopolysaccharide biosynthesis predicted pyruvyltransferase EpsI